MALIAFIVGAGAPWPAAAQSLQPFSVVYELSRSVAKAEVAQSLRRGAAENEFVYDSRAQAKGFIALMFPQTPTQASRFLLTEQGIRPLEFTLEDGTNKNEHDASIEFDWAASRARTTYGEKSVDFEIEAGTLDPLTVYVAVMRDLGNGVDAPSYTVVERGRLRSYAFHKQDEERIETQAGVFGTVRYRLDRSRSKHVTVSWFAPSLGFLPVRMEQWRNGKLKTTMELVSVDGLGTTPNP